MTAAISSAPPVAPTPEGEGAAAPAEPDIVVEVQAGDWAWSLPHHALLRQAVAAAVSRCGHRASAAESTVTFALSDDAVVQALNRQFRGKNKPTNVLSFPAPRRHAHEAAYLGDVILAEETVLREAAEQDKAALHHLVHLCVHGVLHLLGHDHETDGEAARMERLEIEILAAFAIPDPYA